MASRGASDAVGGRTTVTLIKHYFTMSTTAKIPLSHRLGMAGYAMIGIGLFGYMRVNSEYARSYARYGVYVEDSPMKDALIAAAWPVAVPVVALAVD